MSQQQLNPLEISMQQLDQVQQDVITLGHSAGKSFMDAYKYSFVVQKVLDALTPDVINTVFLRYRNKDFGWREDVAGKYNMEQLKDVFTSAILYGALPTNNEILIISGGFYPQKAFFTRKLAELPGLTELILKPGKVVVTQQGGLVEYCATWKYNGKPMSMERLKDSAIPVKLQTGMGADAALGKAERKLKCAIYNQLTGSSFSEGENEEIVVEGVPTVSGVIVTDDTDAAPKAAEKSAPVVSQTAAVAAAVASQRAEKPAPTGPQPWEGGGATATAPAATKTVNAAVVAGTTQAQATPAAAKQQTAAQASQPTTQRQAAPAGQPGPKTTPAAGSTPAAAATKTVALSPAPKFDASGSDEIDNVTLKVLKVLGPKPPHRILMGDNIEYWTKDSEKALKAKDLKEKEVPVFMEYIVEPSGRAGVADFRIVIDLKMADFGNGDGEQQQGEDQSDFGEDVERVVE